MKRLAFVYHPRSFATMEISAAAEGLCELVWIVDRELGETAAMLRLLQRLGDVVDVTGLDHDAAATAVAAARPDGILALHDALLSWTAEVAQRLGLPFHLPQTARELSDKRAQRAALAAAGVAMPAVWPVPPARDRVALQALLGTARFPAVLKPRLSDSSRNTVLVASREELVTALDGIARHTPHDRDALQLEEYLADRPGAVVAGDDFADYVSVETAVIAGRARHLAVTGRFPLAPPFRETGMFIPAALPAAEQQAALDLATAAAAALGVERGCLHTEIKMTPDGPRVIEVNGRIGGCVPDMLRHTTGVELMPIALALALGVQDDVAALPPTAGVGYAFFRQVPPDVGRVLTVEGLDALRARPDVHQVVLNRGPGALVDWRAGTDEAVVTVEGHAADHDALLALRRAIEHGIHISGEPSGGGRSTLSFRALGAIHALTALSTMPLVA